MISPFSLSPSILALDCLCKSWTTVVHTNHRCHIVSRLYSVFISLSSRAKCETGGWHIICCTGGNNNRSNKSNTFRTAIFIILGIPHNPAFGWSLGSICLPADRLRFSGTNVSPPDNAWTLLRETKWPPWTYRSSHDGGRLRHIRQ